MGKITRRGSLALTAAVAATLAVAPTAIAQTTPVQPIEIVTDSTQRVAGADRVRTALVAASAAGGIGDTVILARTDDYADALAAATLADEATYDAPILLNETGALNNYVRAALVAASADEGPLARVVIVGGESAISANVESQLIALGLEVDRIAGADRYETATAIAVDTIARRAPGAESNADYIEAKEAQIALDVAQARLANAQAEFDRATAALEAGEAALEAAEEALEDARQAYDAAVEALTDVAPDGTYEDWLELLAPLVAQEGALSDDINTLGELRTVFAGLTVDIDGDPETDNEYTIADYITYYGDPEGGDNENVVTSINNAIAAAGELGATITTADTPAEAAAAIDAVVATANAELVELQAEITALLDERPTVTDDDVEELIDAVAAAAVVVGERTEAVTAAQEAINDPEDGLAGDVIEARANLEVAEAAVDAAEQAVEDAPNLDEAVAAVIEGAEDTPVFVTTGSQGSFADALATGPAASEQGGVLLLSNNAILPTVAADFIEDAGTETVVSVGGPAARSMDDEDLSFEGADRYATAAEVAEYFFPNHNGVVSIASGVTAPDALVAGGFASRVDGPLVLTWPGAVPAVTAGYLNDLPATGAIFGGPAAIQQSVDQQIDRLINGSI